MLCCVRAGLLNNIYRCGVDAITDMVVTKDAVEEVIDIVITVLVACTLYLRSPSPPCSSLPDKRQIEFRLLTHRIISAIRCPMATVELAESERT
jgi:hypothetical protein